MPRRPYDFTVKTIQLAWQKATRIPGRDPKRWRADALGWPVLKTMRSRFTGLMTHQYDHIVAPTTKEEKKDPHFRSIDNCQLLSAKVNLGKKDNNNLSKEELEGLQHDIRPTNALMDLAEMIQWGDITDEKGNVTSKCYTKNQMMRMKGMAVGGVPPCSLSVIVETLLKDEEERVAKQRVAKEVRANAVKEEIAPVQDPHAALVTSALCRCRLSSMHIQVKRNKNTYFIQCEPTETALSIKQKLCAMIDQPPTNQQLVLLATNDVLEDSKTLGDQKVENDSIVGLALRKDSDEFEEVFIASPQDLSSS